MMAGSFGVANVFDIYANIIDINLDFQIILVTGKNKKLYNQFEEVVGNSPKNTKLIYFTNEINKFMQASDIIITKPGGLTVTEALACNIPMAIFDAIPGQEEENAEFLIKHNMAVRISDGNSCREAIVRLLEDNGKLENMKEACKSFDKNDSSKNIFLLLQTLLLTLTNLLQTKNFNMSTIPCDITKVHKYVFGNPGITIKNNTPEIAA